MMGAGITIQTDDGAFQIVTRQDVRTLWHDVKDADGVQCGAFTSLEDAMQYVTGDYEPEDGSGTLGICGCTDYHMADCHLMTGGGEWAPDTDDGWIE